MSDLTAHYSNAGVIPLDILYKYVWNQSYWSLITLSDNPTLLIAFFLGILIASFLLFIGYRTQLMTALCWIGLVSIQNRNPIIYQGGDDLLRMLLFWSFFLPLSVSKSSYRTNKKTTYVNNVASMAILCQILFPFLFSGLFKSINEWWSEGTSVYYAVNLDQIARPLSKWLSHQYTLTVFLSRITYACELIVFPVFMLPFYREQIRVLIVCFLLLFNLGTVLMFMIGIFPLCFFAALALFIPTSVWNRFEISQSGTKICGSLDNNDYSGKQNFYHLEINWMKEFALGFVFTLIILWNIASLTPPVIKFPAIFARSMYALRLNQSWGMFAPTVFRQDGWLIIKAQLIDGSVIDLNSPDLVLSFDKPSYVLDRFKNDRWRKFTEQLFVANHFLRFAYAKYLIEEWNCKVPEKNKKIANISIIYMEEITRPHNEKSGLERVTLYSSSKD
ncbi:MAG: HTTM domain-containing protein [Ferruginibacter sp.]